MKKLLIGLMLATSAMSANAAVTNITSAPFSTLISGTNYGGTTYTGTLGSLTDLFRLDFTVVPQGGNNFTSVLFNTTTFANGGFDPIYALYNSAGNIITNSTHDNIASNNRDISNLIDSLATPSGVAASFTLLFGVSDANNGVSPFGFLNNLSGYAGVYSDATPNGNYYSSFHDSSNTARTFNNNFNITIAASTGEVTGFSAPQAAAVPEPESILMMMSGLMLVGFRKYKKDSAKTA